MSYPEFTLFQFHRDGHGSRRDRDALPRILVTGFSGDYMRFHLAGDAWVRDAHVFDAAADDELIAGLAPEDAMKLGIEYERVRQRARAL